MRRSRILVFVAALALGSAVSVVPVAVAGAQPPSTAVVFPSNGATVAGAQVVLDASVSSGVTNVTFELTGGTLNDSVIATASAKLYGWVATWDSTTVSPGTYTLQSVATAGGSTTTSAGISIVVVATGPPPSTSVLVPSNGATVSGAQVVLDASATSEPAIMVQFELTGGVLSDSVIATARLTYYGWVATWNSTAVANGTYTLQSLVTYDGNFVPAATSPGITITVDNAPPSVSLLVPSSGATVSGNQVVLDVAASAGVKQVTFGYLASGCPVGGPMEPPFCILGNAVPTYYGWIIFWNTTGVPNGNYPFLYNASYGSGVSTIGNFTLTVAN